MINVSKDSLHELLEATSGVSLFTVEQDIAYDQFLSKFYFDEFAAGSCSGGVQMFGRRGTDYIVIYGEDTKPDDNCFKPEDLNAMSVEQLIELADTIDMGYVDESMTKEEIVDELKTMSYEDYYNGLYAVQGYSHIDYDDIVYGYCQGDVIKVKYIGDTTHNVESLTHLFFDTPISGSIQFTHNGERLLDFQYCDFGSSQYEWDKEEYIKTLKTHLADTPYSEVFFDLIEKELPDEIKYIL